MTLYSSNGIVLGLPLCVWLQTALSILAFGGTISSGDDQVRTEEGNENTRKCNSAAGETLLPFQGELIRVPRMREGMPSAKC